MNLKKNWWKYIVKGVLIFALITWISPLWSIVPFSVLGLNLSIFTLAVAGFAVIVVDWLADLAKIKM